MSDSDISFEDYDSPPSRAAPVQGTAEVNLTRPAPRRMGRNAGRGGGRGEQALCALPSPGPTTSQVNSLKPHNAQVLDPKSWQDVDRDELAAKAVALFGNIAATAPVNERMRESMWQPPLQATPVHQDLLDPLGMGKIDAQRMRLVRGSPGRPCARVAPPTDGQGRLGRASTRF